MMNNFAAIIFSDSYKGESNILAEGRTLASVPFCGRFRMIDFVLSGLVSAGARNVAVITKRNYASLEDHLGGGKYWDLDHRNSGLRILSPFYKTQNNNEVFMARGKLDALRSVQPYIDWLKEEYVVLTNANVVANFDFREMFDFHVQSGADITALYSTQTVNRSGDLEFHLTENGRVGDMTYSTGDGEKLVHRALGAYVIKRSLLLELIRRADEHDYYSLEKYLLINNVSSLRIMGFEHHGFAGVVHTVKDYYDTSMLMLDGEVRNGLFLEERPIMTRTRDSVPALYRYNSHVENSLIADGCVIDGAVKNSIIFRNVIVKKGAVIENSIVMQNCVIGEDSEIRFSVLDKNITISAGKTLSGAAECPVVFLKDTKI